LRLTRRSALIGAGTAAVAMLAGRAFAQRPPPLDQPTPIEIQATPIEHLSVTDRDRRRFGALGFRSGLVLTSPVAGFGGFSGLWRSPDGRDLVALSDNAQWLTGRVIAADGRLAGLADVLLAPVVGADGRPLGRTRHYDTESLALAGGTAHIGVERHHALMRFDWARDGVRARGRFVPVPQEAADLPANQGLEAIGVAPPRSPLAGALVAIAERSRSGAAAPTTGFILTGPGRGTFEVARSDDYDLTDLVFLPDGDVLLLERRFSILRGVAARLRRIAAGAIRRGARIDGPVIFESEPSHEIDNMEGLALHREGDELVVTMISDDNFNVLQRTLLLEFVLEE
jgi:hypothetical protein